jgi:hypothetical protein
MATDWLKQEARITTRALTPVREAEAISTASEGARYRHVKRGTVYEVLGKGRLQCAANAALDDSEVVIYRGNDGKLWARGVDEFYDGRFEPIAASPSDSVGGVEG